MVREKVRMAVEKIKRVAEADGVADVLKWFAIMAE